jgi:hypothetical protein
MPKKKLDRHLPRSNLGGETLQTMLVLVRGCAVRELVAEVLGHPLLQAGGSLKVKIGRKMGQTQSFAELILRKPLHSNEEPTAIAFST